MRLIELIIPSPRAIKKKYTLLLIYKFLSQKVIKKSRNQSTNLFMSIPGMGLRRSSEPKAYDKA